MIATFILFLALTIFAAATRGTPGSRTGDFAVTPLVNPPVRESVDAESDFERSTRLGRIVIPLVLLLLVERELLAVARRAEQRAFLAYVPLLIAMFAVLLFAQTRGYLE